MLVKPVLSTFPSLAANVQLCISVNADDRFRYFDFYTGAELFEYANQFLRQTLMAVADANY